MNLITDYILAYNEGQISADELFVILSTYKNVEDEDES
jgi:hypothetical protein